MFLTIDRVPYVLAPNLRSLVKMARRGMNHKLSTTWTDPENGHEWEFNETTRRWRKKDEYKKKGKKKSSKAQKNQSEKDSWLNENPDLKEIFDEADRISEEGDRTSARAKRLASEIRSMSDSVDRGAQDLIDDVKNNDFTLDDLEGDDENLDDLSFQELFTKADEIGERIDKYFDEKPATVEKLKVDLEQWANIPESIADEPKVVNLPLDALNQIMPFNIKKKAGLEKFIEGIADLMRDDQLSLFKERKLAGKFNKELARRATVSNLNRIFKDRISTSDAKLAALNKQIFETLHPRTIIRVPHGTTQKEYAEIVQKLAEGNKAYIKKYTVRKPKGYTTAGDRKAKQNSSKKSKELSNRPSSKDLGTPRLNEQQAANKIKADLKKVGVDVSDKEARQIADSINYFTAGGYKGIRARQMGNSDSEDIRESLKTADRRIKQIQKYIKNAPVFQGSIYRGLAFEEEESFNSFMTAMKNGMELKAISSFSANRQKADWFATADEYSFPVILSIKTNKSGVAVRSFSNLPDENEVLVPDGVKYKAGKIHKKKGVVIIEMEEI